MVEDGYICENEPSECYVDAGVEIEGPADGSTVPTTTPEITGEGNPGEEITVTSEPGGTVLCTTTVQADGTWSCEVTTPLSV